MDTRRPAFFSHRQLIKLVFLSIYFYVVIFYLALPQSQGACIYKYCESGLLGECRYLENPQRWRSVFLGFEGLSPYRWWPPIR